MQGTFSYKSRSWDVIITNWRMMAGLFTINWNSINNTLICFTFKIKNLEYKIPIMGLKGLLIVVDICKPYSIITIPHLNYSTAFFMQAAFFIILTPNPLLWAICYKADIFEKIIIGKDILITFPPFISYFIILFN